MTAALATRARQQQALDGRWLLEPVQHIDGPVVLVGHSMGGMTIMALADQRPDLFAERVLGVAFVATSAGEVGSRGLPGTLLSRRWIPRRRIRPRSSSSTPSS